MDAVVFQIFCNSVCANIRVHILVIDDSDCLRFFLVDHQFPIHQPIPIGSKAAVPAALPCFLDSALHGLDTDIFTLNLRHSRQDRDHQFARVFGRINAIFYTYQIDAKILHDLKGRKHVRRISAKARQFEHQNIRHAVFSGFDVFHHLAELRPSFNGFAGLSRVLIFPNNLIIVIVCVGFHFGLLSIQRVAVYLHSGGNSGIGVNSNLFFLHRNLPHVVPIQKADWSFLTWIRRIILLFRLCLGRFSQLLNGLQIFFLHGGKSLCLIAFIFRFCFFHRLCMTDFSCMGQHFFTGRPKNIV